MLIHGKIYYSFGSVVVDDLEKLTSWYLIYLSFMYLMVG
jgi:hypothetical protein